MDHSNYVLFLVSTALWLLSTGAPLQAQFGGGSGDGHDTRAIVFVLATYDAEVLFSGGSGDGHDTRELFFSLTEYDVQSLYTGGSGDGHDARALGFSLASPNQVALFGGGSGDGHDVRNLSFMLTSYNPQALFTGGNGDGHDVNDLAFQLTAYDPSALFAGGGGDGHDMALLDLGTALPLTLIAFDAMALEKYVLISWVTTDEIDTDFFTVEKGRGAGPFVPVAELLTMGNTEAGVETHYELRDENPWAGTSYYRLRITDLDGSNLLSDLREVTFQDTDGDWDWSVFPNPNDGTQLGVHVTGILPQNSSLKASLIGPGGQIYLEQQLSVTEMEHFLRLPGSGLAAGSYVLRLSTQGGESRSKMILVLPR